jgi:hypothetical protein
MRSSAEHEVKLMPIAAETMTAQADVSIFLIIKIIL